MFTSSQFRSTRSNGTLKAIFVFIAVFSCLLACDKIISSPEFRRRLVADQCRLGEVCEISPENFDDTIAGKTTIVKFYAPWCGHCKHMAPGYKSAAKKLADQNIQIHEVKCLDYDNDSPAKQKATRELMDKVGVKGFPALLYYKNGELTPVEIKNENGELISDRIGRGEDDIINFLESAHPDGEIGYTQSHQSWFSMAGMKWVGKYVVLPATVLYGGYMLYNWYKGKKEKKTEVPKTRQAVTARGIENKKSEPKPEVVVVKQNSSDGIAFWMFMLSTVMLLAVVLLWYCTKKQICTVGNNVDDQNIDQVYDIENPPPRNSNDGSQKAGPNDGNRRKTLTTRQQTTESEKERRSVAAPLKFHTKYKEIKARQEQHLKEEFVVEDSETPENGNGKKIKNAAERQQTLDASGRGMRKTSRRNSRRSRPSLGHYQSGSFRLSVSDKELMEEA